MSTIIIESWFIPFNILMIFCLILVVLLSLIFLLNIIFDKICHTVSTILVANSCLAVFLVGCIMFAMAIFTLQNDLKQIQYQDSLCIFRAYFGYISCAGLMFSFLLQSIYRYVTVVYPTRLFWQSQRIQIILSCLTWIITSILPIPLLIKNEIVYNVDNQVCQVPFRFSFSIIYLSTYTYTIPLSMIIFIYLKLISYVRDISKRITTVNTLFHAQRELKMVQRIVIIVIILIILGFPYALFIFMSFFTIPPKYHFRIAFIFIDISIVFVIIALFQFTDPLKTSLMKRIKKRRNIVVTTMT